MKTTLYILVAVATFCYASKVQINLKPLEVSFADIENGLGCVFLFMAILYFRASAFSSGFETGLVKGKEEVLNHIKTTLDKLETEKNVSN